MFFPSKPYDFHIFPKIGKAIGPSPSQFGKTMNLCHTWYKHKLFFGSLGQSIDHRQNYYIQFVNISIAKTSKGHTQGIHDATVVHQSWECLNNLSPQFGWVLQFVLVTKNATKKPSRINTNLVAAIVRSMATSGVASSIEMW